MLKDNEITMAEFAGKLGKREIAQGVLGSDSLIITLDDLKKVYIDIKIPENYVGILQKGLIAEISSPAFKKNLEEKSELVSSRIDPSDEVNTGKALLIIRVMKLFQVN